jgi:hypothetical protein
VFLHLWYYILQLSTQSYNLTDVKQLYTGARIVADGHGSQLYDFALQAHYQAEMPLPFQKLLPFNYPPYFAALLSPLARLPFLVMYLIFSIGQWLAYGCAIWALRFLWGAWSREERFWLITVVFGFPSVHHTVRWGNPALFVFLFFVLAFRAAYRDRRSASSGVWIALATIKPHLIAGLFWSFVAGKRTRPLIAASFALVFLLAGALIVVGFEGTISFGKAVATTFLSGESGAYNLKAVIMPNMRGLFTVIGLSSSSVRIGMLIFICSIALFLGWLWRIRPTSQSAEDESLCWATTVPLMLLASPHLYCQDVSLAVLSGILLWSRVRCRSNRRHAIRGFLLLAPIASQFSFFWSNTTENPQIWSVCNSLILAALAIFSLMEVHDQTTNRAPGPSIY